MIHCAWKNLFVSNVEGGSYKEGSNIYKLTEDATLRWAENIDWLLGKWWEVSSRCLEQLLERYKHRLEHWVALLIVVVVHFGQQI